MSYSDRQLHCLEAMGLVAWTSKQSPSVAYAEVEESPPAAPNEPEEVSVAVAQKPAAVNTDLDSSAPSGVRPEAEADARPVVVAGLAQWLIQQSLRQFSHRGASVNVVGPEQAPLLVICLHDQHVHTESPQLPLDPESAQLFELMMRSINMSRNSVRQCAIFSDSNASSVDTGLRQGVDSLCSPYTKALLVLDSAIVTPSSEPGDDHCLMPSSSLPLWRVPHPQQLMRTPALKRRAWEALKQLQNVMTA